MAGYVLNAQPDGGLLVEASGEDGDFIADVSVLVPKGGSYGGVPYAWLLTRAGQTVTDAELKEAASGA
jgi:hypothetical protein